jgi:hypothetical protein
VIKRVGFTAASGATATVPSGHYPGDLILVFAFRDGNTTAPSLGSGFTTLLAPAGANTCSFRLGFKKAASTSESTTTWTNATENIVVVYRGLVDQAQPCGTPVSGSGNNTTVIYPALTLSKPESSWVVGFAGHRSVDTALETAPTGLKFVGGIVDATAEVACHDSDAAESSWSATSVSTGGTSSGWFAVTVELLALQGQLNNYMSVSSTGNAGVICVGERVR